MMIHSNHEPVIRPVILFYDNSPDEWLRVVSDARHLGLRRSICGDNSRLENIVVRNESVSHSAFFMA